MAAASCGSHGVLDEVHGVCICQAGWRGTRCNEMEHPACSLGPQVAPTISIPCAGLRKISPVACECLLSCARAHDTVCGHGASGCDEIWKDELPKRLRRWVPPPAQRSLSWNLTERTYFDEWLTCIAYPPDTVNVHSGFPLLRGAVVMTRGEYVRKGYTPNDQRMIGQHAKWGPLPAYGAGLSGPTGQLQIPSNWRGGGYEPSYAPNATYIASITHEYDTLRCVAFAGSPTARWGCSNRGRCLVQRDLARTGAPLVARCVCVDGAFGASCEQVCSNNCVHDCSGHGTCIHGWCRCDAGWFGLDCSDSFERRLRLQPRATLHAPADAFGPGPVGLGVPSRLRLLPPPLRAHVKRLRRAVFVYDLPPRVNRRADKFSTRYWGEGSFAECAPTHERRIYASQSHFEGHLLHDDYVRTLNPRRARLFYVPTFLMQRHTWGSELVTRSLRDAYEHIRHAHPYWNASGGRDHVFFLPGEKMTCWVPDEIRGTAILLGHWGGRKGFSVARSDCVDPQKDVVVPPITPIQHDLDTYRARLQPMLRHVSAHPTSERNGTLLLFAGGVLSFGASQEKRRARVADSSEKQAKLLEQTSKDRCADPLLTLPKYAGVNTHTVKRCRDSYSMGVRSAVWRHRLFAEPDMRLVSAGIPNYLEAARDAHFCLHTEGNSWGTRLIDQVSVECIPLIVNDGMLFPYHNILPMPSAPSDADAIRRGAHLTPSANASAIEAIGYASFSLHLSKEDVPQIPALLRAVPNATRRTLREGLRTHRRGFVWFRPEGLAYEYTLAALGERLVSYLGGDDGQARANATRRGRQANRHGRGSDGVGYAYDT